MKSALTLPLYFFSTDRNTYHFCLISSLCFPSNESFFFWSTGRKSGRKEMYFCQWKRKRLALWVHIFIGAGLVGQNVPPGHFGQPIQHQWKCALTIPLSFISTDRNISFQPDLLSASPLMTIFFFLQLVVLMYNLCGGYCLNFTVYSHTLHPLPSVVVGKWEQPT